jgi:hypothetical protein
LINEVTIRRGATIFNLVGSGAYLNRLHE